MNIITITVVFLLSYFFTNFIIVGIDENNRTGNAWKNNETITQAVGTLIFFVFIICSLMGARLGVSRWVYGDHPQVFKRILEAVF